MSKVIHRRKRNRAKRADQQVAQFNREHKVGTRVRYWRGAREGAGVLSTTRSEAWNLCGAPVVLIDGTSGGIALTHVEVVQ